MLPTVVSFFAGSRYYYDAARDLTEDCKALDLQCDIREVKSTADEDWADICRKKSAFFLQMLEAHPNGILWVDVDSRILKRPLFLESSQYDFGAYLRSFKSLKEFDPAQYGRTFSPGILHFSGTARSLEFVRHIAEMEMASSAKATDDYFLETAWRSHSGNLSVHLFSPHWVAQSMDAVTDETAFLIGNSGNVRKFIGRVEQHVAPVFEVARQRRLLKTWAAHAVRGRRRADAITFMKKAVSLEPENSVLSCDLADLYLKGGQPAEARRVLKSAYPNNAFDDRARKILVDLALLDNDPSRARPHVRALNRSENDDNRAFAQSRAFRIDLDERAGKRGIDDSERPRMWWMEQPYPGNLGDVLGPYVVEKLSGIPPKFVPRTEGILAVGSIIKFARAGTQVWGAGTPRLTDVLSPDAHYRAVRGPLTAEVVARSGGIAPSIFGDPALLLPMIYPRKTFGDGSTVGLIRHYVHATRSVRIDGVREIDIRRIGYSQIEEFIDELTACDYILSTSLHGLIVAHAYGIPSAMCVFSDDPMAISGGDIKFRDHYEAVGIPFREPIDLSTVDTITDALATLCRDSMGGSFDAEALLSVAPFPIQKRFLDRAARLASVAAPTREVA